MYVSNGECGGGNGGCTACPVVMCPALGTNCDKYNSGKVGMMLTMISLPIPFAGATQVPPLCDAHHSRLQVSVSSGPGLLYHLLQGVSRRPGL